MFEANKLHGGGFTLRVKRNRPGQRFIVSDDGLGVTSRSGTELVAEVGEALWLDAGLREAAGWARPGADHRPEEVVFDLAVLLADGGTRLRHLRVLAGQPELFGRVASVPTATRTIKALADDGAIESTVAGLDAARARMRERGWQAGGLPAAVAAVLDGDAAQPLCIDIDPTLVVAHSDDKDGAAKTYKRTWGFHPMLAYLDRGDGTGEALAGRLRAGNAGANNTGDLVEIFDVAWANLPELPDELEVVVRTDSAAASHRFVDHLRSHGMRFSVGFPLLPQVKAVIHGAHEDSAVEWVGALTQQGQVREGAYVAELTDHCDLSSWPVGTRLLVRREPLHPGAQQTFDDIGGYRFTAFITDQTDADIAVLEVRHRGHARVEDRIRCAKDTGLAALPLDTFARNQLWVQLVLIAQDLLAFTQALCLHGELAIAEPKVLRYKLFHVAALVRRSGRQTFLKIQQDWPWAAELVAAFQRLRALPLPAT